MQLTTLRNGFIFTVLILISIGSVTALSALYWDYLGIEVTEENNLFQGITKTDCHNVPASDVHICYITDKNYVYPTQVSAYSAIKNKCPQTTYHFHIMTDGIDPEKAAAAFRPLENETAHFEIIPQERAISAEFSDYLAHISPSAMMKFIIPNALPNLDRVIYMDSDTLVTKDLQQLFSTDLESNIAGAVADLGLMAQGPYLAALGYKENVYYNSGVLLLDLKKMREKDIPQKLNDYAKNSRLIFIDQDAYNIVLRKHIKTLPYIYNCMGIMYFTKSPKVSFPNYLKKRLTNQPLKRNAFIPLYKEDMPFFYRNVFKDTTIIHYFGFTKPWKSKAATEEIQIFFDLWHQYTDDLENEFGIEKVKISTKALK